jgi:hypothetical protein
MGSSTILFKIISHLSGEKKYIVLIHFKTIFYTLIIYKILHNYIRNKPIV